MLDIFQKKGFDKANIRVFFGKEGIEERYTKNLMEKMFMLIWRTNSQMHSEILSIKY